MEGNERRRKRKDIKPTTFTQCFCPFVCYVTKATEMQKVRSYSLEFEMDCSYC